MKKASTVTFSVNSFDGGEEVFELDRLVSCDEDPNCADIFEELDKIKFTPRKKVVNKLIEFAKSLNP